MAEDSRKNSGSIQILPAEFVTKTIKRASIGNVTIEALSISDGITIKILLHDASSCYQQ